MPKRVSTKIDVQICNDIYRLHCVWHLMLQRCLNKRSKQYKDYGGRGIKIHSPWKYDFGEFCVWALRNGYQPGLQIERINNNGHYSPKNCTWITRTEQARNKRNSRWLTAFGETKVLAAWAEDKRCVVSRRTLQHRIGLLGWNVEDALTQPSGVRRTRSSCRHGHPYPENLRRKGTSDQIYCAECSRQSAVRSYHKTTQIRTKQGAYK